MSDQNQKKNTHPEPDFNAILDGVEQAMKDGTLEELPIAKPSEAGELVRIALEQDAMGGFGHLDHEKSHEMKIDAGAAERIHGKPLPRVHVETYGCQMNTKNMTSPFPGFLGKGLVSLIR